jgi:hypothetical protein
VNGVRKFELIINKPEESKRSYGFEIDLDLFPHRDLPAKSSEFAAQDQTILLIPHRWRIRSNADDVVYGRALELPGQEAQKRGVGTIRLQEGGSFHLEMGGNLLR